MRFIYVFTFLLTGPISSAFSQSATHRLTLKEAIDTALRQNPDLILARLEEQRATQQIIIQKDPFHPKLFAGSGAAWTSGYPQNIDGSAPSIVQARTVMSLYNRPQSLRIAQARESQRSATIETSSSQDDAMYEIALRYLDLQQIKRSRDLENKQSASLTTILKTIQARLDEGRALPLDQKKADLDLAAAQDKILELDITLESSELALANLLGYPAGDRVEPATEERPALAFPDTENDAMTNALETSKTIRNLESKIQSKRLEVKAYKAEWLPQVDVVAQYSLLGHYNYADSLRRFQPNNGELGVSFKLPLLVGPAAKAYASQGEIEIAKLRVQMQQTRNKIHGAVHQGYQDLKRSESARNLARKALEWAQEQLRVLLERYEAGRVPLKEVEEARILENEKWMAYFASDNLIERARLLVLKNSGSLAAALK